MKFNAIRISSVTLKAIAHAAAAAYPEEGCGLLIGTIREDTVEIASSRPSQNVAEENRRKRYTVNPLAIVHAQRAASQSGMDVVGVYHSHPDHAASPSAQDAVCALEYFVYIIVPVNAGLPNTSRAWQFVDGAFCEMELRVD